MSAIEAMLRQPGAQAVGWALLHFVWQGGLVAVSTAAALALLRRSAADVRYVVSAIALSVMLTLPAVTAIQTWRSFATSGLKAGATDMSGSIDIARPRAGAPDSASLPAATTDMALMSGARHTTSPTRLGFDTWLPVIVLVWICGVIVLSLRLVSGWVWAQRMKSHSTACSRSGG